MAAPTDLARRLVESLRPPSRFEPATEAAFQAQSGHGVAEFRRAAVLFAFLGWAGYLGWDLGLGWLDPRLAPLAPTLAAVRASGLLFMALLLRVSLGPRFGQDDASDARWLQAGGFVMFACSYGLMWLAPFPYSYLYYFFGVLMVMVFVGGPLCLGARAVQRFMAVCSVANLVFVLWRTAQSPAQDPSEALSPWVSIAFLLTVALVSVMNSVQRERAERRDFLGRQALSSAHGLLAERHQAVQDLLDEVAQARAESEAHWAALLGLQASLREQAELRDRDKSVFLGRAVHDLRQPVQALGSLVEPLRLRLEAVDDPEARQLTALAAQAVAVMRRQLQQLAGLAQLQSGARGAHCEPTALGPLVAQWLAQGRARAQPAGVQLRCRPPPGGWPLVETDASLLGLAVAPLIDNAVKFRRRDGAKPAWACLEAERVGDRLHLVVADNGVGIAADVLASGAIFRPFVQCDPHHAEPDKGMGLGLSVAQAAVALMPGHHLAAASTPHRGSRFTLSLPLSPAPAPQVDASLARVLDAAYVVLVVADPARRAAALARLQGAGALTEAVPDLEALRLLWPTLERQADALVLDAALAADGVPAVLPQLLAESGELPPLCWLASDDAETAGPPGPSLPTPAEDGAGPPTLRQALARLLA